MRVDLDFGVGTSVVAGGEVDWVVISLERTPERLQQFFSKNAHQDLPFEPLVAVDGLLLDRDELIRDGLIAPDLLWKPGALGSALSHRLGWLRAVQSGRPVVILEDDVRLRSDFAAVAMALMGNLPDDWDSLHFGFNTDSVFEAELVPGCNVYGDFDRRYPTEDECDRFVEFRTSSVSPLKLHTAFGTCAYAVSPKGAQKLIASVFPLAYKFRRFRHLPFLNRGDTHDVIMNHYYEKMGSYVCFPPIALVPNDKSVSTVGA